MSRRASETVNEAEPVAPPAASTSSAPASDPVQAHDVESLAALMSELSGVGNSRVTVYRNSRNSPPAYIFACTPETFSLDDLRDKYNGGEFRLYISREGKLWKNLRVHVEPRVTSTPVAGAEPGLGDLALAMREGFAQQAAALREALAPREVLPAQGVDLPALITALAHLMRPMQSAPPAPAGLDPAAAISLFIKGVEVAKELQIGASGDGDSMLGIVRDLIRSPLLAQAVQASVTAPVTATDTVANARAQARRAAVATVEAARRAPVATAAAASAQRKPPTVSTPAAVPASSPLHSRAPTPNAPTPTRKVNTMAIDASYLRSYLSMLTAKAAEGADPGLYADLILDNVNEADLRALLARQPTPVDALIADYPGVAEHRAWFEEMVSIIADDLEHGGDADGGYAQDDIDDVDDVDDVGDDVAEPEGPAAGTQAVAGNVR